MIFVENHFSNLFENVTWKQQEVIKYETRCWKIQSCECVPTPHLYLYHPKCLHPLLVFSYFSI